MPEGVERDVHLVIQANPETQARLMTMVYEPTGLFMQIEVSADEAWTIAQALVKNVVRSDV